MRVSLNCMMSFLALAVFATSTFVEAREPLPLIGVDHSGKVYHAPKGWPSNAGPWNGKGARYNSKIQKLVFEVFRRDIVGGSIIPEPGTIKAPGVDRFFVAGPGPGPVDRSGTTVLYISGRNGEAARGIGCENIEDGKNGTIIYLAEPSVSGKPGVPLRQEGSVLYANQNKDLAAWHPNGQWIFAAVEMKHHALTHQIGNGEIGMFNNLWAISIDGKTWVQLTHYEKTWKYYDPAAMMPYASMDTTRCPSGVQYASPQNQHPYISYSGSAKSQPPPASGIMRPTVGNNEREGKTPIVWAERVGLNPKYTWAGVLQLATAEIVFVNGIPTLINYRRNLAPSPSRPDGNDLWANPGGNAVIGAGYEPWAFSRDDSEILFASDVCLPSSRMPGNRKISPWSQGFTDVVSWRWKQDHALRNVTDYSAQTYAYKDNGGPKSLRHYGHWEEPAVYLLSEEKADYIAFASSANFVPPWNPMDHLKTFGLDVWLIKRDGKTPGRRITFFNSANGPRWLAYPTAVDPLDNTLFLTVLPGGKGGDNPPGTIYTLSIMGL